MTSIKKRKLILPDVGVHNKKRSKVDERDPNVHEFPLWTEKYNPTCVGDFIGNQKAVASLRDWLKDWRSAESRNKQSITHANIHKCALLSGPSGIGKTSLVNLISKEMGYTSIDTFRFENRGKSAMCKLIQSTSMVSIENFLDGTRIGNHIKPILIVDDADCFSVSDKGGLNEIIQSIKQSKIPMIFICNDRYDPKLKNLLKYCTEIRLERPTVSQIIPRMKNILQLEKVILDVRILAQIIDSANGDVRHCVNTLQWLCTRRDYAVKSGIPEAPILAGKDSGFHLFESIPKIFDQKERLGIKMDVYFRDTTLVPLMVHENYLRMTKSTDIDDIVAISESISMGDVYDVLIHKQQLWEAYPVHGMVSSVIPGQLTKIKCKSYPKFPEWMGKNSSHSKQKNIIKRVKEYISQKCKSSRMELCDGYLEALCLRLSEPLISHGENGIESVIATMDAYCMNKEQRVEIFESVYSSSGPETYIGKITPQLKAKLTRKYNTIHKSTSIKTKVPTNKTSLIEEGESDGSDKEEIEAHMF
jgi:replication factor C subunit 1